MQPNRKQNYDIDPDIRPRFGVVNGGGESTPERGNLRAVDSADDLRDKEENFGVIDGGGESTPERGDLSAVDPNGNINDANEQEKNAGGWQNNVSNDTQPLKGNFFSRLGGSRKRLAAVGIGGGSLAAIAFAVFFALMPHKLEMFIQNITKTAAAIPEHAVEQRTEYLITRALATRMMMLANSTEPSAGQIAFCGNRSISCSLFLTYTSDYFEKKMDLSLAKSTDGKVRLTVTGDGRSSLGSKATSWNIEVARNFNSEGVAQTIKNIEITTNKDMKKYISGRVKSGMKSSNTISRFLARRILMKKYGVTNFRGFEKTQKKVADIKAAAKASIFKNTIGKVAPRTSMYLACLSGGEGCAKLLESYSSDIDLDKIREESGGEDSKEYKAAAKQQEMINKLKGTLSGVAPEGGDSLMTKFISKRILASVGAGLGVAGLADMAFSGISSINNGAMEEIGYDMMKTATIGYAFGDEAGIVVNNDKMKAGDIDINTLGTLTEMFNDAEKSPLMAVENGINANPGAASAASDQVTRLCDTAEGEKPVTLQPNQLVCPERMLVRDYSSSFTNNPAWSALSAAAPVWMKTAHLGFEVFGEAISFIINGIQPLKAILDGLGSLLEPAIKWMISLVVDVPTMGYEASGANNYDTLSAGIRVSQNELMQQGVGTDGKAFGGGGTVLSTEQVAMIQQDAAADEKDYYASQPVLAKMFDTTLKGSFSQHLIASLPTNMSGLLQAPSLAVASLINPASANAATSPLAANPFNMPLYGYGADDPALTADPGTYDEATCATLAQARADSYDKHPGSLVATYTVADPCALEKMVVGAALQNEGITDDPNSLPTLDSLDANTSVDTTSSSGDGQATGQFVWPLKAPDDAQTMSRCYIPGTFTSGHLGIDIATKGASLEVIAADGGEVVWTIAAGDPNLPTYGNALTIKHKDGLFTTYNHAAKLLVKTGDKVTKGQKIAESGNTGNSFGAHLHFEVSKQSAPYYPDTTNTMDPLNYMKIPAGIPFSPGTSCRR
jgi:murein DD-endopeptidase MepM/ murein hydrolase activator NlpD